MRRKLKALQKRRDERMRAGREKTERFAAMIRGIKYDRCVCYWCRKVLPDGGTVDHVTPLAKGGKHCAGNVVPACPECNSEKRDRHPMELGVLL
jgi:5-methylcytosine-specific restriction endonuclease McrA